MRMPPDQEYQPVMPPRKEHPSPAAPPILSLDGITVYRFATPVLHDVNWRVHPGENWAILGPNGSGKSALAAAIAGETRYTGDIRYSFAEDGRYPYERVAWVSFSLQRRLVAQPDGFYQSRWYIGMEEPTLTAREILRHAAPKDSVHGASVARAARMIGVSGLLDRQMLHLSMGEMRRVLIARALLERPRLLLLDEPFVGLDAACRSSLATVLQRLMRQGQQILFFTARPWEVPGGITHDLWLWDGRIIGASAHGQPLDRRMVRGAFGVAAPARRALPKRTHSARPGTRRKRAIELRNVSLRMEGNTILRHVNWSVREGEHWALVGPNGAGKTALLSLLVGDHPQAFAQHVRLFGRTRWQRTLWEWKALIGLASPDLALHYDDTTSTLDFIETGFFDTLGLYQPCLPWQRRQAKHWVRYFGLSDVAARPFQCLSDGQQRLALVARALVKRPPLLVLDEPCQGLDDSSRRRVLKAIDTVCRRGRTVLIVVSHCTEELPACITHCLQLRRGRVMRTGAIR